MSHRRRLDERLAPWVVMAVILGAWWGVVRLVQRTGLDDRLRAPASGVSASPVAARSRSGTGTSVPAPAPARDPLPPAAGASAGGETADAVLSSAGHAVVTFNDITDLRSRALTIPVQGLTVQALVSSYRDPRDGTRPHEAMDIMAPRGTPVLAVEDGRIARLFLSVRGGNTVYQFDPGEQFVYYYAHLDGYAPGLSEADPVHRGQVLGFVGTTGNAPPNAPHLHFAIFKLGPERRWWQGTPLDPFVIWR
jgi:murein DD-endopeptidase MepM/ murein hydrolase activator NlpD